MNIDSIVSWMQKALQDLEHGHIMVTIHVTDGKIVFIRQRKEETKKTLDAGDEEKYSIDD